MRWINSLPGSLPHISQVCVLGLPLARGVAFFCRCEHIYTSAYVSSVRAAFVPSAFTDSDDARHYPFGDFCSYAHDAAVIESLYQISVTYAAG